MMNLLPMGEETTTLTTVEDRTTTTPNALQRVHEVNHTMTNMGVVVGVFLHEEQCVKKKQEMLPLTTSSSPSSSSSSSICDGREQSSCSSQEDTCSDVEAQSTYHGPLDHMSALENSLPIKYKPFFFFLSFHLYFFLLRNMHFVKITEQQLHSVLSSKVLFLLLTCAMFPLSFIIIYIV
jgi:hypothetical protein